MPFLQPQIKVGFVLFFSSLLFWVPAGAENISAAIFTDVVVGLDDFPTIKTQSGRRLVLSGIEQPESHGLQNYTLEQAKRETSNQLRGQQVIIRPTGNFHDLFGRVHAMIRKPDGIWINHHLLNQGLVRVQLQAGFTEESNHLFQAEKDARLNNKGLWATGVFKRNQANPYTGPLKGFVIVTGKIIQSVQRRHYLFINFDNDWRTDFTIGIPTGDNRFDIKTIKNNYTSGSKIEIRGLIENWNGPFIKLEVPQHLRLIAD